MDSIETAARNAAPACDAWTLRYVDEASEQLTVRNDVAEPAQRRRDRGAMVSVTRGGALGYAATADLSEAGLRAAFAQALKLAQASVGRSLIDFREVEQPRHRGQWRSPNEKPLSALSLADRFDLLARVCASANVDASIVERTASLWTLRTEQLMLSSAGARIEQAWDMTIPGISAVASANGDTQMRSAMHDGSQQGGLEVLERASFEDDGVRIAHEALQLVHAPNCPSGDMDLLLMPDQMLLQIHESIGHPLELDRILGDERNFAGTSFVTLDMFGSFRYGSDLLNVTYAPDVTAQLASFAYDDEGTPAKREWLIKGGILLRPLGGALSQARARQARPGIGGVATSRACSWNRPPIDRMSNLNVEAGTSTLDDMVASIDEGILMRTNRSWSIDDSRNKFQFGCEYGRMIRGGKLAEVVKRPNYRGISASFWRSLDMVGDAGTFRVMGSPFCGKGEPNQVIRVGHASPACKFSRVAVFGGAK
ncbi:MAG: TldD/PmbA family protein [Burkholderiales bacterium]|nr:TldD/PmbA family protein [Burkholderiales bacterium]